MALFKKSLLSLKEADFKVVLDQRNDLWGAWSGLFGLSDKEMIVITLEEDGRKDPWSEGVEVLAEELLVPTERPKSSSPLVSEGLYVFRSFEMESKHIDDVVELSRLAWRTFERGADYSSEPVGLFKPERPAKICKMWLLTWYDGFSSWQASRKPHPEAQEFFRKRQALVTNTKAIAVRLITQ